MVLEQGDNWMFSDINFLQDDTLPDEAEAGRLDIKLVFAS